MAEFLTVDGSAPAFPWDLGQCDPGVLLLAARHYALPQALPELACEPHAGLDRVGCSHVVGARRPVVVTRGRVDRCAACVDAHRELFDGWGGLELHAAAVLAHWTAWAQAFPSASSSATLAATVTSVAGSGVLLEPAPGGRLATLVAAARAHLADVPPGFDAPAWAAAASMSGPVEDVFLWALALAAGASAGQAREYVEWSGGRALVPAGPPGAAGSLFVTWAQPSAMLFANDVEATLGDRLRSALGGSGRLRVWAVDGPEADVLRALLRSRVSVSGFGLVEPSSVSFPVGCPAVASVPVADAATRLWQAAAPFSGELTPRACVEAAVELAGDAVALDTAVALAGQWHGSAAGLVGAARGLTG